jgi:hypothetical protein
MRINELLPETITLQNGARVIKNPTINGLISFLMRSQDKSLRGLVDGSDIYWWDAAAAIHGDVAKELANQEYTDDRLHLVYNKNYDEIRFDATEKWTTSMMMTHPRLKQMLADIRIFFYGGSYGWITGSELLNL